MRNNQKFENALRKSLPEGFALPDELWNLVQWLESREQSFQYRNTSELFMPTTPIKGIDHLWSHLTFVIEPELVRHWFGRTGLETKIVPIVKCGADGSHFAAWKDGEYTAFVFLGSEGEAFKVTSSVQKFIALITMGYFSLEDRHSLVSTPASNYAGYYDDRWPDPVEIKKYIQSTLGIDYPETGERLIDNDINDPFVKWVDEIHQGA